MHENYIVTQYINVQKLLEQAFINVSCKISQLQFENNINEHWLRND